MPVNVPAMPLRDGIASTNGSSSAFRIAIAKMLSVLACFTESSICAFLQGEPATPMGDSSSVLESLLPDRGTGSAPSNSDQTSARAARSGDMESGHVPKVGGLSSKLPLSWLRRAVTSSTAINERLVLHIASAERACTEHLSAGTCLRVDHPTSWLW